MADFAGQFIVTSPTFSGTHDNNDFDGVFVNSASAGVVVSYVNRVFDSVAAGFVRWTTLTSPDSAGTAYPGPDAFGNTTDYCVERVL